MQLIHPDKCPLKYTERELELQKNKNLTNELNYAKSRMNKKCTIYNDLYDDFIEIEDIYTKSFSIFKLLNPFLENNDIRDEYLKYKDIVKNALKKYNEINTYLKRNK